MPFEAQGNNLATHYAGYSARNAGASGDGCILAIGRDIQLLATRADVLRTLGRSVRSATPDQARLVSANTRVDLVVLGHSLADEEVARLARDFRRAAPHPRLLLLCLQPRHPAIEDLVDACMQSTDGPANLIEAAKTLLFENRAPGPNLTADHLR